MATTVNYGNKFKGDIVIRPAIVSKEDLLKPGLVLNKTTPQVQLGAGIHLFEFLDTSIPPQAKTISGTGTISVETVIP